MGEGRVLPLTRENEKITDTCSVCRSHFSGMGDKSMSISYIKKPKLSHSSVESFVYHKNLISTN